MRINIHIIYVIIVYIYNIYYVCVYSVKKRCAWITLRSWGKGVLEHGVSWHSVAGVCWPFATEISSALLHQDWFQKDSTKAPSTTKIHTCQRMVDRSTTWLLQQIPDETCVRDDAWGVVTENSSVLRLQRVSGRGKEVMEGWEVWFPARASIRFNQSSNIKLIIRHS
jgi:hypothetical protein